MFLRLNHTASKIEVNTRLMCVELFFVRVIKINDKVVNETDASHAVAG